MMETIQILNYLANKHGGIFNKSSAMTLIWLSDRLYLKNYDSLITNDYYVANPQGVQPFNCRFILNNYIKYKEYIKPYYIDFYKSTNSDYSLLTEDMINTIETVYRAYGHFSKVELKKLAYTFPEFQKYEMYIFRVRGIEIKLTNEELNQPFADPALLFAV